MIIFLANFVLENKDGMHMEIETIITEAETWGIKLSIGQACLLQKYFKFLCYYNEQFNLTRLTGAQEVLEEHFLDAYAGFSNGIKTADEELLDLGSGAGFPGLPIKIFIPELKLFLLDSSRKKILFLKRIVKELNLENVNFIHKRAEDYGRGEGREKIVWVTARGFAPLNVAAEIALPLLKVGGYFWAFKGPDFKRELDDAEEIITRCGGVLENILPYSLPRAKKERTLLIIKKINLSEEKFPRKAGIPQKRPFLPKR